MNIEYLLKNDVRFHRKVYTLKQIEERGLARLFDIENYKLIARRRGTGIEDKNGKEIFEGDIRREENPHEGGDERLYFVCTWIKELAMFSWLEASEYIEYTADDPQEFDVIFDTENPYPLDKTESHLYAVCSTVYEKPELLNPLQK